jgi:TrmH family RNA methyltransferase
VGYRAALSKLETVRFVLVRTEEAGNVGATARVLRNFGLSRLVLVAPQFGSFAEARKWAHGAEDVLEGAEIVDSLEQALEGCEAAWAATRRLGRLRAKGTSPGEAAAETVSRAAGGAQAAWVFGPESRGLSTEEVARCGRRVTIPTAPEQPSLNLAQAAAIAAYELYRRTLRTGGSPAPRREATVAERQALYGHLEEALLATGFLHHHTAQARMAAVRALLERSRLSPREVRLLRGVARQILWAVAQSGRAPAED